MAAAVAARTTGKRGRAVAAGCWSRTVMAPAWGWVVRQRGWGAMGTAGWAARCGRGSACLKVGRLGLEAGAWGCWLDGSGEEAWRAVMLME